MESEAGMLTTGDVARALGVSINTVKNWVKSEKLSAVTLPSGHLRIPRAEFERLTGSATALATRRMQWQAFEARPRETSSGDASLESVLEWVNEMVALARSHGELVAQTPEEKATRVARMHRALKALST